MMQYIMHNGRIETPVVELILLVVPLIWLWILLGYIGGDKEE